MEGVVKVGDVFGKLTVIERGADYLNKLGWVKDKKWFCLCECGVVSLKLQNNLRSGKTTDCGCGAREVTRQLLTTHGQSKYGWFRSWRDMKARCDNPNNSGYENYGGRGIKYCERWADVLLFKEDMAETYAEGLELDRIDFNGDYCKENCRWVDSVAQGFNKRVYKTNKTGVSGIFPRRGRYQVYISKDKIRVFCGSFSTFKEALLCRFNKELEVYGYSKIDPQILLEYLPEVL